MLTKHRGIVHAQTLSYLGKLYRAHAQIEAVAETTPLIASNCSGLAPAMATLSLCSNVATGLLTGIIKNRPRLSLRSRLDGYSASACLAGLSKHAALLRRSFDNASLWPEALGPPYLCAHAGFHPVGGGGSFPPPPPPPKRKRERRKEEKERERERERERKRERCMVWEGERGHFCVALQVISIVSYFMTQLFKSTR